MVANVLILRATWSHKYCLKPSELRSREDPRIVEYGPKTKQKVSTLTFISFLLSKAVLCLALWDVSGQTVWFYVFGAHLWKVVTYWLMPPDLALCLHFAILRWTGHRMWGALELHSLETFPVQRYIELNSGKKPHGRKHKGFGTRESSQKFILPWRNWKG